MTEIHASRAPPNILTIAGSDSGGGAGVQADLKTFSALGTYGTSVITALTAQNTRGVQAVDIVSATMVGAQLDAVFSDIRIDAVKVGMLGNCANVRAVVAALQRYRPAVVIVDTVMLSTSGHALIDPEAIQALRDELLPLATLTTPNLPEMAALLGLAVARDEDDMVRQGLALRAAGCDAVLVKGGHLEGDVCPDWLIQAQGQTRLGASRIDTSNTHGTGCTLSAAIAALHPQRPDLASAVNDAKAYLSQALLHSSRLHLRHAHSQSQSQGQGCEPNRGHGPVHHFHAWW